MSQDLGRFNKIQFEELAHALLREYGLPISKKTSEQFIDDFFTQIQMTLAQGNRVKFPGIGTLSIETKEERVFDCYLPHAKGTHVLPKRKVVKFNSSKHLSYRLEAKK
ncbi:HU family DNA-binding protein [Candidatus Albibeggiatoa sp. nov. NOAA]|uniref:HU family DNA-binding protein n=1 Tax=Candidatus Albibeggiatoa sp. nov. NOAA TaxID=3162724 RepID=UPI0032F5FCA9|nr:HU family DNA-binding protein [Thiotrichaceae bacterium]